MSSNWHLNHGIITKIYDPYMWPIGLAEMSHTALSYFVLICVNSAAPKDISLRMGQRALDRCIMPPEDIWF
jgi:hypothetical protein